MFHPEGGNRRRRFPWALCALLLADDHALVRAGIRALLESLDGVEVIGEASDGHDALRMIGEQRPDLALLDISMPGLNGLEVTARATREYPRTRVIVLSMHADDEYVYRALRAGATGYLLKNADRRELELAVRAVARGEAWLSPAVSKKVIAAFAGGGKRSEDPVEVLTPRQREILQLVAEGHSTKEIAQRLVLSVKTVESHRTQLMERLGIHDVSGLVRYAIRLGIVRVES
jgi:DNA-binding NarL/FixJ family response regulator